MRGLGVAILAFLAVALWPASAICARLTPVERAEIGAYPDALVLARNENAQRALRRAGAVRIAVLLPVWRVRSAVALRVAPLADLVEADRFIPITSHFASGDPLVRDQWWIGAMRADAAEPPGPGKPVTVIDTGIDTTHEEFSARPSTRILNNQAVPGEGEEHGTAVASTIGAPANGLGVVGVYPGAALQIWDATPLGPGLQASEVVEGIDTALRRGPSVINLSLGAPFRDPLLEEAVNVAFGSGSLVVAAAGNDRHRGNALEYPAGLPHVLTVGATDQSGRSTFFSGASAFVDLVAPGQDIPAAEPFLNSYGSFTGTSFSAPLTAGVAAWVWTTRPALHVTQLFDLMRSSAQDIEAPGFDPLSGFGRLDVPSALAARELPPDPREPNEDLGHILPRRLFRAGLAPITTPRQQRVVLRARLDVSEDPRDVYRVWVPAHRKTAISLSPGADIDLAVWGPRTVSVLETGRFRRRDLRARSERPGPRRESAVIPNRGRRGAYYYVEAYPGTGSPVVRTVGRLSYSLSVSTAPLKVRARR